MEKNLELATKLLYRVEATLINKDFKAVKLILQSYRNQLRNSSVTNGTNRSIEELTVISDHCNLNNKLLKLSQKLLEELVDTDDYKAINALTLIISDLQSSRIETDPIGIQHWHKSSFRGRI